MEVNAMNSTTISQYKPQNMNNQVDKGNKENNFLWEPSNFNKEQISIKSEVKKMIEDIQVLKEKLDVEFTLKNILELKNSIKSFLEYYVENALEVKKFSHRNENGVLETFTVVKKVENEIEDLENSMALLGTRNGQLEMLKKIGEIEGLLLNLFL